LTTTMENQGMWPNPSFKRTPDGAAHAKRWASMATLSIVHWRESPIGFTGWDTHANSEMKRRLKRAMDISPALLRQHIRQIQAREPIVLVGVKEEAVASVRQILETQGAEVVVALGGAA